MTTDEAIAALRQAVKDALDAGVPLESIDGIVYLATLVEDPSSAQDAPDG